MAQTPQGVVNGMGVYFDGIDARPNHVRIELTQSGVIATSAEDGRVLAHWPLDVVRRVPCSAPQASPFVVTVAEHGPPAAGADPSISAPQDQRLSIDPARSDAGFVEALVERATALDQAPRRVQRLWRVGAVVGGGAVGLIALLLTVLLPFLAERMASIVPVKTELALGRSVSSLILGSPRFKDAICDNPAGRAALEKIRKRLADAADAHVPIRVTVVASPEINAFAMPGGRIVIFSGLLRNARSPEEVAGVLAHEIGHVIGRDGLESVIRSGATFALVSLLTGDLAGSLVVAAVGDQLLSASYTRAIEEEADDAAIRILAKAGISARPLAGFFDTLIERYGDDGGVFATHPLSSERSKKFAAQPDIQNDPLLTPEEWEELQFICG